MGVPHWFAQAVGSLQHLVGLGRLIKCSGFECATRDQKVDHNVRTTWKCGRPDGSAMCTSLFSEGVWSLSIPWA